jgi:FtsH-binding integral membrane protein
MSRLEHRCRRMLRAYPQAYQADRGEEILGTLLDATPAGRSWPPARDAWSVITGGLHVRAARNRQLPLATNLRLAALLAASLWHGLAVGGFLFTVVFPDSLDLGPRHAPLPALGVILFATACALGACLAIASAWFWRRSVTITLALAVAAASALGLTLIHSQGDLLIDLRLIGPPLALAALATGKDRPPRTWLWLPGLWLTAAALQVVLSANWWSEPDYPLYIGFFIILGITVLWLVVDARPAIAVGLCFELTYLTNILLGPVAPSHTPDAGASRTLALIAAALAGAAIRTRRRAIT